MVREFGAIHSRYWQWAMEAQLTPGATMLGAYLMTCEHSNLLGCFRVPVKYIAADLPGFDSLDSVESAIGELVRHEFIQYDMPRGWVWLQRYLEWNTPDNPNKVKSAYRIAQQIPEVIPFAKAVMASVCKVDRFGEKCVPQSVHVAAGKPAQLRLVGADDVTVPQGVPDVSEACQSTDVVPVECFFADAGNPFGTLSEQGEGEAYTPNGVSPLTPLAGGTGAPNPVRSYASVAIPSRKRRREERKAGNAEMPPVPEDSTGKERYASVVQVLAGLRVTGVQRVSLFAVVWSAIEEHAAATRQSWVNCANFILANERAWREAKQPCFSWAKWIGEGHCWHVPKASGERGVQTERAMEPGIVPQGGKLPLDEMNRLRALSRLPLVTPERYAEMS